MTDNKTCSSHRGAAQNSSLLGCDAMSTGTQLLTLGRHSVNIPQELNHQHPYLHPLGKTKQTQAHKTTLDILPKTVVNK